MNLFMPTVQSERLVLRPLKETDANDLFQIYSDSRVVDYLSFPLHASLDETRRVIQNILIPLPAHDKPEMMVLEEKSSQKVIGSCSFSEVKGNDIAEIGYFLNHDYWNHGYISEALGKLIEIGFTSLGLRRTEIVTSVNNLVSQRVIEKAGFTFEGTYRRYIFDKTVNDYADCRVYSLLKEEWEAIRK